MYYGYHCYNKDGQALGWLYTFSSDTEYAWTNKDLHWCKRWKTERGAKKHFDNYNRRWQFKSHGGYLKIEIMPDVFEQESVESRRHRFLEEWGDSVIEQSQTEDEKSSFWSFPFKSEIVEWLEQERWKEDDGKLESNAALINRKLEKLMKLERQGF